MAEMSAALPHGWRGPPIVRGVGGAMRPSSMTSAARSRSSGQDGHHRGPVHREGRHEAQLRGAGKYMDRFAGACASWESGAGSSSPCSFRTGGSSPRIRLACARIGAVLAPIPPDYRRREVEFILGRTEAPVYIGPATWTGFSHRTCLQELAPALPSLRHRIFLGRAGAWRRVSSISTRTSSRTGGRSATRRVPWMRSRHARTTCFNVLYTSGTTGEPKGVIHSYNTNYAITRALSETMSLDAEDVISLPSLLTASSGFTYLFRCRVLLGATAVYLDVADPDFHLQLIEEHGISFMYAIPTYYLNMLSAQRRRPRKIGTLGAWPPARLPCRPPHRRGA